jgi:hypothetical protein
MARRSRETYAWMTLGPPSLDVDSTAMNASFHAFVGDDHDLET